MISLKSKFMAVAALGLALAVGQGDVLGDAGVAGDTASTTTTTRDTGRTGRVEDRAAMTLAFKESPEDAKVRLAVKLAEQDPAGALRHIDLVNAEGGLQPHHIEALTSLAADAKDELAWQAWRAKAEQDLAFNDANRLAPTAIHAPEPEVAIVPASPPAPKLAPAAPAPAAPSPFGILS